MKWHIITDSSSDLHDFTIEENSIIHESVPFAFNIGNKTIVDDPELDTNALLEEISKTKDKVSTACPSPNDFLDKMKEEGNYIIITISAALSGSYNSASLAKNMILEKYPNRNIEVINSKSTGPEIVLLVEKICELIKEGKEFNKVIELSLKHLSESKITFALSSYDNLIKAGRMPRLLGTLAKIFKIWGIGIASEEGTIDVINKTRGEKKVIQIIVDNIAARIIKPISVIISHCHNLNFAEQLKEKILETWEKVKVKIMETRGLCSYYAEKNGVLVGFCK